VSIIIFVVMFTFSLSIFFHTVINKVEAERGDIPSIF